MSNLVLPRRGFLRGLGLVFAAPAIVRASSLMPVRVLEAAWPEIIHNRVDYLTLQMITRKAVRLWTESNSFIEQIDQKYAIEAANLTSSSLRIRLPSLR